MTYVRTEYQTGPDLANLIGTVITVTVHRKHTGYGTRAYRNGAGRALEYSQKWTGERHTGRLIGAWEDMGTGTPILDVPPGGREPGMHESAKALQESQPYDEWPHASLYFEGGSSLSFIPGDDFVEIEYTS